MALNPIENKVKVEDEEYSLAVIPSKTSQIVSKSRTQLLGAINLPALVEDLGRVGSFIRIAYNGVAGCTQLQIQVQRIGYEITKLCDRSAVTVAQFSSASTQVLEELQCCYGYLFDGLEEMAVEIYIGQSKIAEKMSIAAKALQVDFDKAKDNVVKCLEDTQTEKGRKEEEKTKYQKDMEEYEIQRKKAQVASVAAQQAAAQAEELYKDARRQEDKILEEEADVFKQIINTFAGAATAVIGIPPQQGSSSGGAVLQSVKEVKLKQLEEIRRQQDARTKALQAIAEMTARIGQSVTDSDTTDATIAALHNAIGGLKNLSDIMSQAALFWEQMSAHCKSMAEGNLKVQVEKALTFPEQKRLKIWTSKSFMTSAIREYGHWVALNDVCSIYMDKIKETQADLHAYLRENPTVKESRENVKRLAVTFGEDLQKAIQKIEEDRKETLAEQNKEITGKPLVEPPAETPAGIPAGVTK